MTKRNVWMLLLSIGIMIAMASAASADDWASFQGNNNNNGVTLDAITTTFANNWTFNGAAGGWAAFDSAPVIGNGIAYYVYSDASVYAINMTTGNSVWTNTTFADASTFEIGTPAYDSENNRLYVGLSYGNTTSGTVVIAFNASTGIAEWYNDTLIPAEYQINSPIKYNDSKVYVAAANMTEVAPWTYVAQQGGFYCLDADTGVEIWNDTSGYGHYYTAPAIAGDYVVIADDGAVVRSYDINGNGTPVDSIDISDEMDISLMSRSAVVYDPGALFEGMNMLYFPVTASPSGDESYLIALEFDPDTGLFGDYDNTSKIESRTTTSIAVSVRNVYVASDDGVVRLYQIKRFDDGFFTQDTPVLSTTALGPSIKSSPVVTINTGNLFTERVYITHNSMTGGLYYYEFNWLQNSIVDSGSWIPDGSGFTLQGIAAADGYLTFGNDNKKVFTASD